MHLDRGMRSATSHRSRPEKAHMSRADAHVVKGIEDELANCHRLSATRRIREILLFISIYLLGAGLAVCSGKHAVLLIPGILLMGVALNSLGIFIHDGIHGLLARNATLNRSLSFLCGLPLLISGSAYQVTHCDHHFEFGRKLDYGTYRQHLDNKMLVWGAYFLQLFLGSVLYVLLIPVLAWKSASVKDRWFIAMEYAALFSIASCLLYQMPMDWILIYWVYPSFVLMILSNIRGLASHALGKQDDIYLSSRTIKTSPLLECLFLNENFHLEHHLFPQVPSYHLKQVHSLVWHRLPKALYSKSYLAFLIAFFKAFLRLDLDPRGVLHPGRHKL